MKSDVRRTQARDHLFAFSLFSHWTSAKSKNRHSHALRRSLFFLAAVRVPVHILDFCNTSQASVVFLSGTTWKVLTAFALFTSGLGSVTFVCTSSILNEKHCRISTVFPRATFSRLRRFKPTRKQDFLRSFWIFVQRKSRFPRRRWHHMQFFASPPSAGSTKKSERRNARECQFWFFEHLPSGKRLFARNNNERNVWRAPILWISKWACLKRLGCSKKSLNF